MSEPKHDHPHTEYQHEHGHNRHPYWRRAHRDWKFWVAIVLMLLAMATFVLTNNLSRRPQRQPELHAQ
ncbi:MAG TPA: hypothetical protein VFC78_00480 [Tepidisphaeraceae bacterium]|nr:hypothetical protein [Tepidisphaeraceae bacterium]